MKEHPMTGHTMAEINEINAKLSAENSDLGEELIALRSELLRLRDIVSAEDAELINEVLDRLTKKDEPCRTNNQRPRKRN